MDDVSSSELLRPGALEGLDAEACARLRRCGIDCVEELVSAGALEIARASELGLTRIMRWQALASHGAGEPVRTLQPPRRFSPNETGFIQRTPELEREIKAMAARSQPGAVGRP
jgi:hypothetical protein